jgi:hypothetical protein
MDFQNVVIEDFSEWEEHKNKIIGIATKSMHLKYCSSLGEPETYPFIVTSVLRNNYDKLEKAGGPFYEHFFVYQEDAENLLNLEESLV